jgi:hypothetical protein
MSALGQTRTFRAVIKRTLEAIRSLERVAQRDAGRVLRPPRNGRRRRDAPLLDPRDGRGRSDALRAPDLGAYGGRLAPRPEGDTV